ncbi:MAG TPA: hypothetical protein VLB45_01225 [Nitrosopumilaceae archaeon]|nr:hypothetical protein [Nitrosopumilaceae archaeon]
MERIVLGVSLFLILSSSVIIGNAHAEYVVLEDSKKQYSINIKFLKYENKRKYYSGDDLILYSFRDDKFLRLIGKIDGVPMHLFGKKIFDGNDIDTYLLKGKTENGKKLQFTMKINDTKIGEVQVQPVVPTVQKLTNKINLVSFSPSVVTKGYSYNFFVRTYDSQLNPIGNTEQNWGILQDVNVSIKILDKDSKVIKQFNGVTGELGYYNDGFVIPYDLTASSYFVIINATKDGYSSDSDQFWLHILELITEGNTSNN